MTPPAKGATKGKTRGKKNGPAVKKHKGWKQMKMTAFAFGGGSGNTKSGLSCGKKTEKVDEKIEENESRSDGKEKANIDEVVVVDLEEESDMVKKIDEENVGQGVSETLGKREHAGDETIRNEEVEMSPYADGDVANETDAVQATENEKDEVRNNEAMSHSHELEVAEGEEIVTSAIDKKQDPNMMMPTDPATLEAEDLPERLKKENGMASNPTESEVGFERPTKKLRLGLDNKTTTDKPQESAGPEKEPLSWDAGAPVPYLHLARAYEVLEKTPGRLESIDILKNVFKKIAETTPEDLLPAVYLTVGRLAPAWKNVTLSLGGSTIAKAVTTTCSVSRDTLRKKYKDSGDLGDAALAVSLRVRRLSMPRPLTVRGVFNSIKQLSVISGKGGQKQKSGIVTKMVASCREVEIKYIVRTLISNLRIGAVDKTVLSSLAAAFGISADLLASSFATCPSYDVLIPALLKIKERNSLASADEEDISKEVLGETCKVTIGIPLKPMLGKITRSIEDMVIRFGDDVQVLSEYKYDGQRAQIHVSRTSPSANESDAEQVPTYKVQLFSRHLQDMTSRFPDVCDIVSTVAARTNLKSGVFDAEIVAVNAKNIVLPFQALAARPRSTANSAAAFANKKNAADPPQIQVCVVCFDTMMLNDEILFKMSLQERRQKMQEAMKEDVSITPGWKYAESITTRDPIAVQEFLDKAVSDRCEGLMCKALTGPFSIYEPATRRESWSKVKKDYLAGGGSIDIDVVCLGAWQGQGRKYKWYSPVLVAVVHDGELQSLCKVMSGFTDEMYENIAKYHRDGHILESKPSYYQVDDARMRPSVWFDASQVWEIKGADLSISPVHKAAAGLVDEAKGLSLRFPRFIRIRDDKGPEDITTAEEVAEMFYGQANRAPADVKDDPDESE